LPRVLLVEHRLGRWSAGRLPDGIKIIGPDLELIKSDPGFVARARAHGNEVHVWTVNASDDIRFCRDLGVTGFTTDYPDLVAEILAE
jgi:glycerophosphoryl diester phosphodiesterase